ncbi:MAG: NifU family protein [Candidatus Bathyarchaeia archaeon]
MRAEVEKVIKEIQPSLRADGGDIELVDVTEDGTVKVRLKGACAGCPFSMMTLQFGVERYLKARVPQVKRVIVV